MQIILSFFRIFACKFYFFRPNRIIPPFLSAYFFNLLTSEWAVGDVAPDRHSRQKNVRNL